MRGRKETNAFGNRRRTGSVEDIRGKSDGPVPGTMVTLQRFRKRKPGRRDLGPSVRGLQARQLELCVYKGEVEVRRPQVVFHGIETKKLRSNRVDKFVLAQRGLRGAGFQQVNPDTRDEEYLYDLPGSTSPNTWRTFCACANYGPHRCSTQGKAQQGRS